jgi:hypothetical protein
MPEARGSDQYLELNDLSFSLADGLDSCSMLLSHDISVEHPFDLEPRYGQDSLDCISNAGNASTSTTGGSFPSVPAVDEQFIAHLYLAIYVYCIAPFIPPTTNVGRFFKQDT